MRGALTASALLLALLFLAGPVPLTAAGPQRGSDGSLVLGGDSRGKGDAGDSLYELQSREVHAYITKYKTWIWNRGTARRPYTFSTSSRIASNPQVEMMISKYANYYGVDPALVRAVVRHESGFNSQAVSPKGAQGLMQLMPGTAALMGVTNPFDPEQNIAGGVGYLRHCLDRFQHNVPLAVAAYNAGPEAVAKYGCNIPPYAETQTFVQNVMGTYNGGVVPPPKGKVKPVPKGNAAAAVNAAGQGEAPKEAKPRPRAKIIEVKPGTLRTIAAQAPPATHSARIIEVKSKSKSLTLRTVED